MAKTELKILGVKISNLTRHQILSKIKDLMKQEGKWQITTPNPEFLLEARKDNDFLNLLNKAELALPDGIGLKFAGWCKGVNLHRYPGSDFVKDLLNLAQANDWRIAIINWHAGLSSGLVISKIIKKLYPNLKILVKDERRGDYVFDISDLKNFQPQIILSTLGAPYQEKIVAKLLPKTTAKLGVGVGGSFDFLTGKAHRAPKIFRMLGLEWLWRLLLNPKKRFRRIYNAVAIFPLLFVKEEIFTRFFYRPDVVAFVWQGDEVLLVSAEDSDKQNHWKLPSGGIEPDETPEEALIRELTEEINNTNFEILAKFVNIFKYKWPPAYRRGYKGQKQTLFICELRGDKNSIKLNFENTAYKWVKITDFIEASEPVHQEAYKLYLAKFKEITK